MLALSVIYLLVGIGFVVATVARHTPRTSLDLVLLVFFWPLYGPFVVMGSQESAGRAPAVTELLEALERAGGTPLAELLPDTTTGSALAARVRMATDKLAEIDALLARPDFDESAAESRHRELEQRGDERAAAIARSRVHSIRRLRSLRDRFRQDLDEVRELVAQLRIQAEVVRLADSCDDGTRELVSELLYRVRGLDELIEAVHG